MAHPLYTFLTPVNAIFLSLVTFLVYRICYELTTGAARRRLIAEHGCKPAYHYEHKGFWGRWLGLDVVMESMKAAKEGRLMDAGRIRYYGTGRKTVVSRRLFSENIMTIEPENVKTILATKFQDFSLGQARTKSFIPLFGHGIFDTDGPAWERSRALIRPNFVRQQVADLDMFEVHVGHLFDNIPRDGSMVDLQSLFFDLTIDSATEFLFGKSTNILSPALCTQEGRDFVHAFIYCTEDLGFQLRTFGLSRWIPNREWHRQVNVVHSFADSMVQDALKQVQHSSMEKGQESAKLKYTFLHELCTRTQDPYTLRSELLNVLLAGRDTTAGLLSNTWHVLARRPDIWAKLRQEVDALNGELPSYSTIKEMKYLKWVLNESLRLMPVVPGNSRQAVRDTVLPTGGGPDGKSPLFVPKLSMVTYQTWSMHRREDFYGPDALEFKPERWEHLRPGWEYLPFNGGPRICVGQQYALLEASYVTIRLMQEFKTVKSMDDREWGEQITVTLSCLGGCKVALLDK